MSCVTCFICVPLSVCFYQRCPSQTISSFSSISAQFDECGESAGGWTHSLSLLSPCFFCEKLFVLSSSACSYKDTDSCWRNVQRVVGKRPSEQDKTEYITPSLSLYHTVLFVFLDISTRQSDASISLRFNEASY